MQSVLQNVYVLLFYFEKHFERKPERCGINYCYYTMVIII